MAEGDTPRAGRLETLGAWLHVWTPRRGVYVPPPPPRRKLVRWTVAIGVPLAALLAVGLTLLAHARDEQAARERREAAAVHARELARMRVEQRPHHGRGRSQPPLGRPARLLAARHALVRDLERAITTDARERSRKGQLDGRVERTVCFPYTTVNPDNPPEPPLDARVGKYDCLASVGSLRFGQNRVTNGYPFWARIHYASGRFTWCKINRLAGEGVATGAGSEVPLARECDLTRPAAAGR
jgi:hypothetical protein